MIITTSLLSIDDSAQFRAPIEIMEPVPGICWPGILYPQSNISSNQTPEAGVAANLQSTVGVSGTSQFGDAGKDSTDATVVRVRTALQKALDRRIKASTQVGVDSSFQDWFGRPGLLSYGSLAITDGPTTFGHWRLFKDLIETPYYANKLSGRYMINANVRVKLQVNANRFIMGRYILAWLPDGGATGATRDLWTNMHRHCKTAITQLPHVEIDLATQTEVELCIPYTSFMLGYMQGNKAGTTSYGDTGSVFIYPYSPMVTTAGSTSIAYSLWASFENVELGGVALPQSDIVAKEQMSVSDGVVSSTLNKISRTANVLGKIPLLSAMASTTSWGASILANAARIWGWSKPSEIGAVTRVTPYLLTYNSVCDTADTAQPLSLFADNHVCVAPGFASTDQDEMSFDYIKSIPAYLGTFPWASTASKDANILTWNVSPFNANVPTTVSSIVFNNYTPMGYLASQFAYWRGGMTFTLKFVKTEFHSGRLMVSFNPYSRLTTASPPTNNVADSPYILRQIIDIRLQSEMRFTIPYQSVLPWTKWSDSIGTFEVAVLDKLVFPATVPNTIQILLEVSAADDFEVAAPIPYQNVEMASVFEYQSDIAPIISATDLGGSSLTTDPVADSEYCIGEKVNSVRSLLKKYDCVETITTSEEINVDSMSIRPFLTNVAMLADDTVYHSVGTCDNYSRWAMCYALHRGGVRIRIIPDVASEISNNQQMALDVYYASTSKLYGFSTGSANPIKEEIVKTQGLPVQRFAGNSTAIEVMVPQYHFTHSRLGPAETGNVNKPFLSDPNNGMANPLVLRGGIGSAAALSIYRAGADDLSFGRFVSVPVTRAYNRDPPPGAYVP
jgi:hypothetical protein